MPPPARTWSSAARAVESGDMVTGLVIFAMKNAALRPKNDPLSLVRLYKSIVCDGPTRIARDAPGLRTDRIEDGLSTGHPA